MTGSELRAAVGLAGIYGLRMLGMFVILPVFAIYAEHIRGGYNLTLVGIALGAYGLTQAILQIPFGWFSDRWGRKPVIYGGLVLFALGSLVAGLADSIYAVIIGRVIQGAGAISAAVIALMADLTREEQRTKAMALIGSTIGGTFALSLVLSPWLNDIIGVPGIFMLTGVLALLAIGVVYAYIPDVPQAAVVHPPADKALFSQVLRDPQLARLNFGILALHAVLMGLFIVVPLALREHGLAVDQHWRVYLPVMVGSFVLMVPAILMGERYGYMKKVFVGAVLMLLISQLAMPWLLSGVAQVSVLLLIFFTGFNVLEASLPSLISKCAPAHAKGTAIGIYSSIQFVGTFVGAAGGGFLYQHFGVRAVFVFTSALLAAWLVLALGMRVPGRMLIRAYQLPALDPERERALLQRLKEQPGVRAVELSDRGRTARLKVDVRGFDEQHVIRLIEGEI